MRPCTCTYCLMSWMASSYFIPLSIRANATKTGALCALTNTHTHSCLDMPIKDNNLGCPECVCVTSPVQPRSERPRSIQDPPGIFSSADSASHRPVYLGAELHHQMASPEVEKQVTCCTSDRDINHTEVMVVCVQCICGSLLPPHWCRLSPVAFYRTWCHRREPLWWRRSASDPEAEKQHCMWGCWNSGLKTLRASLDPWALSYKWEDFIKTAG